LVPLQNQKKNVDVDVGVAVENLTLLLIVVAVVGVWAEELLFLQHQLLLLEPLQLHQLLSHHSLAVDCKFGLEKMTVRRLRSTWQSSLPEGFGETYKVGGSSEV